MLKELNIIDQLSIQLNNLVNQTEEEDLEEKQDSEVVEGLKVEEGLGMVEVLEEEEEDLKDFLIIDSIIKYKIII